MFFVYLVSIGMLFSEVSLYGAASSSGAPVALAESVGRRSPKKGGSGLARGMSAVCLDLERAGIIVSADHYDAAQQHIETQLSRFDSYMPHSARSVQRVRQQLERAVERQKAVLSDSVTIRPASSSSEEESGSFISSEESELPDAQQLLKAMQIANSLLTQHAVRAQDGLERAEHENRLNKRWAYIGASLGAGGIIVSILFGIVSFGIAC